MIRISKLLLLVEALLVLTACTSADEDMFTPDDALEIKGIHPTIGGNRAVTRAAADVSGPSVNIGRTAFVDNDKIVFTSIKRTNSPINKFTYSGIHYKLNGTSWKRDTDEGPEKIYWSDNKSEHTFIGYSLPVKDGYEFDKTTSYQGQISTTAFSKAEDIAAEDLLLCHSLNTEVGASGIAANVNFAHALSCMRVVVDITGYGTTAKDTKVNVSNMVIKSQPTQFTWNEKGTAVEQIENSKQADIVLWDSIPGGKDSDKGKSKSFVFYGLTVPHDGSVDFEFKVKYSENDVEKTYKGSFETVKFESALCTTLNISLNHRNEVIGTDVEYNDWKLVISPDLGELRKKSTFMDMEKLTGITTHGQDGRLTIDDATWLYMDGAVMKDIYGNEGSEEHPYIIKSAAQLLSFAREVNGGESFTGKYIRLDADITMQAGTALTKEEGNEKGETAISWEGIGDGSTSFNGTFLGGDRYINRLAGSPLFVSLGKNAVVEQLHITTVGTIDGGGALADSNAGIVGGCKVIDDVNTTGGALVGTNSGSIHACYYTGSNDVPLVGSGTTVGCYVAKEITSFHDAESKVSNLNDTLDKWYKENKDKYKSQFEFVHSPGNYPTVKLIP